MPDKFVTNLDGQLILDDLNVEKRKKTKINFLCKKVSDINMEEGITFFGGVAEISDFSVKDGFLTLKY